MAGWRAECGVLWVLPSTALGTCLWAPGSAAPHPRESGQLSPRVAGALQPGGHVPSGFLRGHFPQASAGFKGLCVCVYMCARARICPMYAVSETCLPPTRSKGSARPLLIPTQVVGPRAPFCLACLLLPCQRGLSDSQRQQEKGWLWISEGCPCALWGNGGCTAGCRGGRPSATGQSGRVTCPRFPASLQLCGPGASDPVSQGVHCPAGALPCKERLFQQPGHSCLVWAVCGALSPLSAPLCCVCVLSNKARPWLACLSSLPSALVPVGVCGSQAGAAGRGNNYRSCPEAASGITDKESDLPKVT